MKRKKPLLLSFFSGLFRFFAFIVKGVFFSIVFLFKGSKRLVSGVKRQASSVPAKYVAFETTVVKGSVDSFERRLLNESLVLAIAGRRGSGKSGLGFRILENIHAKINRPCFVLGVSGSVLPVWIGSVDSLSGVSNRGVVLVDEGAVSFGSRNSMSKENKSLTELLATARHKDLTLIFITQNTGMIDKTVLNLCDVILFKEGSLLQEKMERGAVKDLYKTASVALSGVDDKRAFCYVFDAQFEGLLKSDLPTFWSSKVSKNRA